MESAYRILVLDTKPRNPNHYLCLAICDALRHAGVETVYVRYDDAIRKAREHRCNVFLAFDGEEMHSDICRRLAALCDISVLWIADDPYEAPVNLAAGELFDLVFTNDRDSVSRYGAKGRHLPFAGSTKYHHLPVLPESSGLLRYDVLFIGAAWPNRVHLLNALVRDLPGRRFKIGLTAVGDTVPELPMPKSAYLWRTSMFEWARLANRSRITLALHRDFTSNPQGQGLASTPPPRLFEAALAGTLQFYDASISETAEYFEPGREVVSYASYRECLEKIQHYLFHPEERHAMASAAQLRALQSHTYRDRVQHLLVEVGKHAARKTQPVQTPTASRRPRLLFVTHQVLPGGSFGGVEVYQEGLARNLLNDYDVLFYYPDCRRGPNSYVLADAYYKSIEELHFDGARLSNTLSVPIKESAFATILDKYDIDLVHFQHLNHHPASLVLIARLLDIPVVLTLHDFWVMCDSHNLIGFRREYCDIPTQPDAACDVCLVERLHKPAGTQAVRRAFFRRVLASANAVIGNTQGFHEILARFYPETARSGSAHVIPVPLPASRVVEPKESEPPRVRLSRDGPRRILRAAIFGNFTLEKGAETLICTMNALRDAPVEFTIFGRVDVPYDKTLRGMKLPNLKLHGLYSTTDLPVLLRDMDVSLHMSIWPETYCITLSESWHNNVLPIVSNIGALGERVIHGENGWKVDANNAAKLVDLLRRLIEEPALITACRARSAGLPRLYETETEHTQKLDAVYRSLLEHRCTDIPMFKPPGSSRLTMFDAGIVFEGSTWTHACGIHREATQVRRQAVAPTNKEIQRGSEAGLASDDAVYLLPHLPDALRAVLSAPDLAAGGGAVRRTAKSTDYVVVIPAFNEEGAVASVVREVQAVAPGAPVLVIDDCSDDATRTQAEGAGAEVLTLPHHLGLGGCVQAGYKLAFELGYEYVIRVDGDGQHDPADIPRILDTLRSTGVHMVIGSRYVEQNGRPTSVTRGVGILLFRAMLRPILGKPVHDPTSGYVGVNRAALELFSRSFPLEYPEIEALVVLQRKRFQFQEIPCRMRPRKAGRSSITPVKSVYYIVHVLLGVFVNMLKFEGRRRKPEKRNKG